jgi:DNA-binding MarR family transcriptional regulator
MHSRLQHEIKQRIPFASLQEEVFLSALRTADCLLAGEVAVLREAGLTFAQYNVLRILRGALPGGLSCREISDRMVTQDSDLTRLLDRLETAGFVTRKRDPQDRRVILPRITEKGLAVLDGLDKPVARVHRDQLRHMTRQQLETLAELLATARHGVPLKE